MGDNIPGKPRQALFYLDTIPSYYKKLNDEAEACYEGFELTGEKIDPVVQTVKGIRSKL